MPPAVAMLANVNNIWWNVALALVVAFAGAAAFQRVRGTTLAAPSVWWIVSALAIAAVETAVVVGAIQPPALAESLWRYTAAVSLFCPLTAVLGAKRPQDRGWQWVVLSLWVVLLVPAGQALASSAGQRLELYGAWRALLTGFIAMGLLNYLPTRYWLAALLTAAGQTLLLSDVLLGPNTLASPIAIGLALLLAAFVVGWLTARNQRAERATQLPTTARWLAFRNGWGAFWALRVFQRINQTAVLSQWPIRLEWSGFAAVDRPEVLAAELSLTPPLEAAVDQALDNLLRRFERLDFNTADGSSLRLASRNAASSLSRGRQPTDEV